MRHFLGLGLVLGLGLSAVGCGAESQSPGSFGWIGGTTDRSPISGRAAHLRWRRQISSPETNPGGIDNSSAYVPVERAAAVLDPRHDRIYIGSSAGDLWALSGNGSRLYTYDAGASIAAQPALDVARDELFVPTEGGVLHKLSASTGESLWRVEIGGACSQTPVVTDDAIYILTDNDIVIAIDRENGEPLWRYRREVSEGFYVSGHAGLTLHEERLLAAFTGGVVVALHPSDGSVLWERDTALELEPGPDGTPRFADVDTTPVVIGDLVYVASFAGGVFGLDLESGTVEFREEELTGVTSITEAGRDLLILSSGDLGVVCLERHSHEILWRKRLPRGAPGTVVMVGDLLFYGESQGGFVTLSLTTGRELGRLESGHGFSATPTVVAGRGFVLSNGGALLAFAMPGVR